MNQNLEQTLAEAGQIGLELYCDYDDNNNIVDDNDIDIDDYYNHYRDNDYNNYHHDFHHDHQHYYNHREICQLSERERVLACIKTRIFGLSCNLCINYRADREIVLATIMNYGADLEYASAELQADREIVLAAIKNCWYSLKYASEDLRADRDIVFAAIIKHEYAIKYSKMVDADYFAIVPDLFELPYYGKLTCHFPKTAARYITTLILKYSTISHDVAGLIASYTI